MMRVSKDPNDKAYEPTAASRRVWSNDQEILDWVTADEFRRVVITSDGQVLNGAVRIEQLWPGNYPEPLVTETSTELPADVGFAGAGLVFDKPKAKPEHPKHPEHPTHPEQSEKPSDVGRPGDPDEAVVVTPIIRPPAGTTQV